MASVTEQRDQTVGSLPIDVETISETVDLAWRMSIGTATREDIDATTIDLIGHLNLLRSRELGEDRNTDTLKLLRMVERHLSPENRPTSRTPAHEAYHFMRDSAVFLKSLLAVYKMVSEKP